MSTNQPTTHFEPYRSFANMVKGGPRRDEEHLGGENMEDSSDEDDTNDEEDSKESDQEER